MGSLIQEEVLRTRTIVHVQDRFQPKKQYYTDTDLSSLITLQTYRSIRRNEGSTLERNYKWSCKMKEENNRSSLICQISVAVEIFFFSMVKSVLTGHSKSCVQTILSFGKIRNENANNLITHEKPNALNFTVSI